MNKKRAVSVLFVVAALYDGVLGLLFLTAGGVLFERLDVAPPNHWGYVQFPALLLIIFGLMFAAVAASPSKNRNLIPYGILLKTCYSGLVFFHWFTEGIPGMWKPFAVFDLGFLALFVWAYVALGVSKTPEEIDD